MRVSKATKRASETSEQTLHRQLISGTMHAQFAEGLHFSAFHLFSDESSEPTPKTKAAGYSGENNCYTSFMVAHDPY